MRSVMLSILFVLTSTAWCSLTSAGATVADATVYDTFEFTVTNETAYANPFVDTELRLKVKAPSTRPRGELFDWFGFHDGDGNGGQIGHVWKARLLPDAPGEWKIAYRFVDPSTNAANGPIGELILRVTPNTSARHGHVRAASDNWMRLRHDDGTPWVPFPIHASMLLDVDAPTARRYIDQSAALGVNALTTRFHAEAKAKGIAPASQYQWLGQDGQRITRWGSRGGKPIEPAFDYARFDVATWRRHDEIARYAADRNVKLSIWFGISGLNRQYQGFGPHDYPNNDSLGPQQRMLIRYLLARWAPMPVWWHWTVDSEYEETGSGAAPRVLAFAREMRQLNPWGTILTTHVLRNWTLGSASEMDLATIQRRVVDTPAGVTDCRSFIEQNLQFGKPVYNSEGVWTLSTVTHSRIATLSHLFAGGFSHVAHSDRGGASSWFVDWEKLSPRHREDAAMLGALSRFFNGSGDGDISMAIPRNDLVRPADGQLSMCLADEGIAYWIWLPEGGDASIDLSRANGQFTLTRYSGDRLDAPVCMKPLQSGRVVALPSTPDRGFGRDYLYVLRHANPAAAQRVLSLLTRDLPPAVVHQPYRAKIETTQTNRPVKLTLLEGALPDGLALSQSVLSGTPTKPGKNAFTVAADDGGATVQKRFELHVLQKASTAPVILDLGLAEANENQAVVAWKTQVPADSRVQWGTQLGDYVHESGVVETGVTDHRVRIKGSFKNGQVIYVLVISADEQDQATVFEERLTITF